MRVKTSVTLSEEIVRALDRAAGKGSNRSRLIEEAVRDYLARPGRAAREARDLEILNRSADTLNREAQDVLEYQADV
jgi:metal-responsive CopG/Arc/MetJ family transcriptional regulator